MYTDIGALIAERRREKGMNQAELAAALDELGFGVTNQAVSKWEKGATLPNARQFLAICDVLGIEDIRGTFSGTGGELLAGLNREGAAARWSISSFCARARRFSYEEPRPAKKPQPVRLRTLPLYSLAVSAGTGQFLDGEDYEMVEVGQEVPEGSNFGVRVAGDSMEPEFHDGQTVWVRQQRSLMTGDIGIFLYDGSAYLKQLVALKDSMALHSLNPAYADIVISPELPLRVLGKVLR